MYELMCLQIFLLPEKLTTDITGKWLLPTMHAFMCFQMTPLPE
jgi:hypothetical protein